ncbi:hypothetical protein CPB85DRAFT_1259325 [Mucidula mucida]|nr:hypothetical protein CPB85DRAFT_1259325 [Mucidula mucida]
MSPKFDLNRKANQAALLRSLLLSESRTNINAKHNHSASSTSTAASSSSSEALRTSPNEAAGVINHGTELNDVMQTKGVNLSAISSSFPDVSVTRVHPKSLLARITRTNTAVGQRVTNERPEGIMSPFTHASSKVSEIKIHRESMLARIVRGSVQPQGEVNRDIAGRWFDLNRKANQAALLRSLLLSESRTNINAKHNHSASSTSTAASSSSSEVLRTSPNEAAGVINHGTELNDVMQTKGVNLSAISSSFPDVSVTKVHPKSLLAQITRTNTTVGQRVTNERPEGIMSPFTHASSKVSEIKIHRESMLARIVRGSVQPQGEVNRDIAGRWVSPSGPTMVAVNQSAPFLPNGRAIIPGYVNNSTIQLCQFIALVIFTIFNGPDSASEFLDYDECSSLTAFIWRTNNSLTAKRYWVSGLKNPAVLRSIVYLLRMFPSKIPINSIETIKHAFAGLGTPNFDALKRLALQVVDYNMLVRGDWTDCSVRHRECIPHTTLKRSGCLANMDKARLFLKALDEPDISLAMEERRMTARKRQDVEKKVLEWIKGVCVQIPYTSGRYEGPSNIVSHSLALSSSATFTPHTHLPSISATVFRFNTLEGLPLFVLDVLASWIDGWTWATTAGVSKAWIAFGGGFGGSERTAMGVDVAVTAPEVVDRGVVVVSSAVSSIAKMHLRRPIDDDQWPMVVMNDSQYFNTQFGTQISPEIP